MERSKLADCLQEEIAKQGRSDGKGWRFGGGMKGNGGKENLRKLSLVFFLKGVVGGKQNRKAVRRMRVRFKDGNC